MDMGINNFDTSLMNQKNNTLQKDLNNISKNSKDENLKAVCDDFESFFMQQMLDISMKSSKIAGEGTGSDIIKGMYTESLSQQSKGALGISTMLYEFLSEKGNKKS
jgi:Rod binding domain-containing protein